MNVMPPKKVVNVAIMGCGLIGTQWDHPGAAHALTHAAGFSRIPACKLVAVCDQSLDKAKEAAARWGVPRAFSSARAVFDEIPVDLVVIATSSAARSEIVEPALDAGVRVFVIEKPLATTLAESQRLAKLLDQANAKTIVNYSRRWDPAMSLLRAQIAAGELGGIQRLIGLYGKGLVNNASHMIDLVSNICQARPTRIRALGSPLNPTEAHWSLGNDLALDAQVEFIDLAGRKFQLTLLGTDQTAFTCFELKIIGSKAVYELQQGGRRITCASVVPDPDYAGYRIPSEATPIRAGALESMNRMTDEAVRLALGQLEHSSCDIHTAMTTAITIEAIRRADHGYGAWIDLALDY